MKTLSIDLEPDYDFSLIGICCHSKDFRLCWEINQRLAIDFVKTEDLILYDKKAKKAFPFFIYDDAENGLEYSLIKNRSLSGVLIPEENKVDYFLIIKGPFQKNKINEVCSLLRKVNIVLTAYPIEVSTLKSKQNLIY